MPSPFWTAARHEQLADLWETTLTTPEIAKRMGVSKNSIIGKAHRLGLIARPSPLPPPGHRFGPAELAEALRLRAEGVSALRIGRRMGFAESTVQHALTSRRRAGVAPAPACAPSAPAVHRPAPQATPPAHHPAPPPYRPAPVPPPRPSVPILLPGGAALPPPRICQWIDGEVLSGGRWSFCGEASVFGRSWCSQHMQLVFVSIRRDAQAGDAA